MAELAGVSPGYYCDTESSRRNPPDREILDKMITTLHLSDEEKIIFYNFAGKARGSNIIAMVHFSVSHSAM